MSSKERKSFFWASYADLMTSLFFVMIVLFVLSVVTLNESDKTNDSTNRQLDSLKIRNDSLLAHINRQDIVIDSISLRVDGLNSELQIKGDSLAMYMASESELKVIRDIETATRDLDPRYFAYDDKFKKHRLKLEVKFKYNKAKILEDYHDELEKVGQILKKFIDDRVKQYPQIQYLLIIEGQASKDSSDKNYQLSYERSLALVKFWEGKKITFEKCKCEVLICGSGDGKIPGTDIMRDPIEENNQRFLIHIIPKPGVVK